MPKKITWKTEKRKLSELTLNPKNPRTISDDNYKLLQEDLGRIGNMTPIVIDTNNTIIGGNQRYRVFQEQGQEDVDVMVPSRELSESERKQAIVLLNKTRGEDDIDMLANEFEETLKELGLDDLAPIGEDFQPLSGDSESRLDKKKAIICPQCGHEFTN